MKKVLKLILLSLLCAVILSGCMLDADKNSIQTAYQEIVIGQTKMCQIEERLGHGTFVHASNGRVNFVWHFGEMTLSLLFDDNAVLVYKSKNW